MEGLLNVTEWVPPMLLKPSKSIEQTIWNADYMQDDVVVIVVVNNTRSDVAFNKNC